MATGKSISFYIPDEYVEDAENFKERYPKGAGKRIGQFCRSMSHEKEEGFNAMALEEVMSTLDTLEAMKQSLEVRKECMTAASMQPLQTRIDQTDLSNLKEETFKLALIWLKRAMTRHGWSNFEKPLQYFRECPKDVGHYASMCGLDHDGFLQLFEEWLETNKLIISFEGESETDGTKERTE